MLKPERMALELLEYQIDDLVARRPPKGGLNSPWLLHDFVLRKVSALSTEEKARFTNLGQTLRELHTRSKHADGRSVAELQLEVADAAELELGPDDPAPGLLDQAELEEQSILKRLAKRVRSYELERAVERLATAYRAERERQSARVLYGFLRNFEHYSRETTFFDDVNLIHFRVRESIPELADPLVSLSEAQNISSLILEIIELILTLKKQGGPHARLRIREEESLDYLRRMASAVARDPYAGRLTAMPPKGPTSRQLRLALEELGREPMREEERQQQRRRIQERLRAAQAYERTQRELFAKDAKLFREAVDSFFDQLANHLPRRVGGRASEPRLPGGVLFAVNPALRLDASPRGADALTVHVKGPVRFGFAGEELALTRTGSQVSLHVAGREHAIDVRSEIRMGRKRLLVFHESCYVHLKLLDTARSLAALAAEALLVVEVLSSSHTADLLALLRTATGVSSGDPEDVVRQALARLSQLVSAAPDAPAALAGFVRGSLRAAGLSLPEHMVDDLVRGLARYVMLDDQDLETVLADVMDAKVGLVQLGSDPRTLQVAGQTLTVRKYPARTPDMLDSVVLLAPGRVLASFEQSLIAPFEGGTLVCCRSGDELLALFFKGVAVNTDGR